MKGLKGFFAKYANLGVSEKRGKEAFISSVKEVVGIELTNVQVKIKSKEVTLVAPSALRFAVLEHKKEILEKVRSQIGDTHSFTSIR